ncbi:hypothetical protein FRC08_005046 [Ceratobasidium sp. 394]|nr:hypothetical protein FRC08_005046 [Ceratobasidium sp. 394]
MLNAFPFIILHCYAYSYIAHRLFQMLTDPPPPYTRHPNPENRAPGIAGLVEAIERFDRSHTLRNSDGNSLSTGMSQFSTNSDFYADADDKLDDDDNDEQEWMDNVEADIRSYGDSEAESITKLSNAANKATSVNEHSSPHHMDFDDFEEETSDYCVNWAIKVAAVLYDKVARSVNLVSVFDLSYSRLCSPQARARIISISSSPQPAYVTPNAFHSSEMEVSNLVEIDNTLEDNASNNGSRMEDILMDKGKGGDADADLASPMSLDFSLNKTPSASVDARLHSLAEAAVSLIGANTSTSEAAALAAPCSSHVDDGTPDPSYDQATTSSHPRVCHVSELVSCYSSPSPRHHPYKRGGQACEGTK